MANGEDFAAGGLWVFAYGSLMWRPGFAFDRQLPGAVRGWRRSLCVYSHIYRGTAQRPGLVLGLDRGGSCRGVAFCVAAAKREATIAYLRERELVTDVYFERFVRVDLGAGESVDALTYVVNRAHAQYAGRLTRERLLALVRQGAGQAGDNSDYVRNTSDHLRAMGIRDRDLDWLADQLRQA